MEEERRDLTLLRLRDIDARLSRLSGDVSDMRERLYLLETDMAGQSTHRVRHEGSLAEFRVMLDAMERRLGIMNG